MYIKKETSIILGMTVIIMILSGKFSLIDDDAKKKIIKFTCPTKSSS